MSSSVPKLSVLVPTIQHSCESNLHHASPGTRLFDETRGSISYRESNHACMDQQVASKAAMMSDFEPPP